MDILVVEPIFDRTKAITRLIVSLNCEAEHVLTARDALEKIKDKKYDGIIISHILPDMTGELFAGLLKGAEELDAPPVLVVDSVEENKLTISDYIQTVMRRKEESDVKTAKNAAAKASVEDGKKQETDSTKKQDVDNTKKDETDSTKKEETP